MVHRTLILLFGLLAPSVATIAQRTETAVYFMEKRSRLVVEAENDVLFQSDNYYTVGLALSYTNRSFRNTPAQLILKSSNTKHIAFSGFGIQQRIYTPHSIVDPYGIEMDRPYSAYLLATNYAVLIKPDKNVRISNEIGIGIMGSSAWGKEVQTYVHEIINSAIPVGWDDQLQNTFLIDYQFRIEKGFFNEWTAKHLIPFAEAQVGTLMDRVNIGLMTKFGNINDSFKNEEKQDQKRVIFWETVVEANFHGVFYDATLEGGFLNNDAAALDREETITRQYQLRMGVNIYYRSFSLRYMVKFNSNNFHAGGTDRYGSINIGVAF